MSYELKYSDKKYLELYEENKKRIADRRTTNSVSEVVFVKRGARSKVPKKIYESQTPYIFLQYLRIVTRWGQHQMGVNKSLLDLMLYLYPIGIFSKHDFYAMCSTITIYKVATLEGLIKKGLVKVWRKRKSKEQYDLYCLTVKATSTCSKMHTMLLGEEGLPEYYKKKLSKSGKSIDKYYLKVIKRMEEKKAG